MKITRLFVTGYKNLYKCEIRPQGLHVITGCNGTGKSNFLEVLPFISLLVSGSEGDRERLFNGYTYDNTLWVAMLLEQDVEPEIHIEGEVDRGEAIWEFKYVLRLSVPNMHRPYDLEEPVTILQETFKGKEKGKPGSMRTIVKRDEYGRCIAKLGLKSRKSEEFNVVENMSVLAALKIREASEFREKFPIISRFLRAVNDARIVSLNPKMLISNNKSYDNRLNVGTRRVQSAISSVSLYRHIDLIQKDEFRWEQLTYWAEELLRITKISIKEDKQTLDDGEEVVHRTLLLTQDGKILWPYELSTGSIVILALLCIFLSPLSAGRVLLVEEPEAYIHPKAIVDLLKLMKTIVYEGETVIMSTHSPIVLNSVNADQVTLLAFDENKMARSKLVSDIDEASEALSRGQINFGDLLESNFDL